jgi:hypothetical protein
MEFQGVNMRKFGLGVYWNSLLWALQKPYVTQSAIHHHIQQFNQQFHPSNQRFVLDAGHMHAEMMCGMIGGLGYVNFH